MTSQSLHLLRGRIHGLQCWFWTRSEKLGDMKLFLKQVSFARANIPLRTHLHLILSFWSSRGLSYMYFLFFRPWTQIISHYLGF
jgi:hypothetical protein